MKCILHYCFDVGINGTKLHPLLKHKTHQMQEPAIICKFNDTFISSIYMDDFDLDCVTWNGTLVISMHPTLGKVVWKCSNIKATVYCLRTPLLIEPTNGDILTFFITSK
uniref:Uncharacterized protein n=1 Tax=Clastoptera arizonana TaxID=38151 RepID=A0A1B6D650_9HEMI